MTTCIVTGSKAWDPIKMGIQIKDPTYKYELYSFRDTSSVGNLVKTGRDHVCLATLHRIAGTNEILKCLTTFSGV